MGLPEEIYAVQAEVNKLHEGLTLLKEEKREHEIRQRTEYEPGLYAWQMEA